MRARDGISIAFGGAALATSVLAVGGALRWTQAIIALLVAAAFATQLLSSRRLDRLSPLVALLLAAAALTALQLVPLPDAILDAVDATGNQLRNDGAELAATSPWPSISLDPPATLRQLAFIGILFGVALVSLRFAASERGRYALLAGVALVCGLAALVTGIHTAVHADSLYALYEPKHAKPGFIFGPLLNPNHLGGLMAMGVVLSVGLSFYHRQRTQFRVLWVLIGLGCAVVCAMTYSRGAMLGMVIGLVVCTALLVAERFVTPTMKRRSWRNNIPLAIVFGFGLVVALYFSAGTVVEQLGDTSVAELEYPTSKYAAWKSSLTLVEESPWFGIGRGATETVLTRVHPASGRATFSHLENEYLSTLVEWGIVGTVILGALLAWCLAVAYRRRRDGPLSAAALGALAMIAFQSGVDFGVQLLGLAVPVIVIASTVQIVPLRVGPNVTRTRAIRGAVIAALVGCAVVLLLPATRSAREDRDAIVANGSPTLDDVRESIERHPLDYIGFGEAAALAWQAKDPKAVHYLNHALRLHPTHPGLHRLAARLLVAARRRDQAALEYSLAMNAEASPRRLLAEILLVLPDADHAALALPTNYSNVPVMLHSLRDIKRDDVAIKWLLRVAARQPRLDTLDRLYDLAMDHKDYDAAKTAATMRFKQARTTTSRLKLAKVMWARKEHATLITDLRDVGSWTGRIDEKVAAWLILCDAHIELRDWNSGLACLHRLDASGLLVGGRMEVTKRLAYVTEQRTNESKKRALEELERSVADPPKK